MQDYALDAARERTPEPTPAHGDPVILWMHEVTPKPVTWLWPGRIAQGKLALVQGDPGLGKSMLTADLAARVSAGIPWPDREDEPNAPGGVVMLSAEDDPEDMIAPRLVAADADRSRIALLRGVHQVESSGSPSQRGVDLTRDLPAVRRAIEAVGDCRLVIVDPVLAYLGRADTNKSSDIRQVLTPLSALAQEFGVAILAVTHLNKNAGGSALYRGLGSVTFTAAARTVWGVVKDKDDSERRLFLPVKSNLAADVGGLAYTIVSVGEVARVRWERDPVDMTMDDAMEGSADAPTRPRDRAQEWLSDTLANGPMPVTQLKELAAAAGIHERTLERAKSELGARAVKSGTAWEWQLEPVKAANPANPATV